MEKNSNIREKIHVFNGLNSIEIMLRNLEIGTIESIKKLNPFMQMFFDSDLDSEIEKNAVLLMSDAYYSTIVEVTTGIGLNLKKAQALGNSIANTISYTMGLAKLTDKYFRGLISEEKYYSELSKRLAAGAISLLKHNWESLGKYFSMGLRGVLLYIGIDPVTIETCISLTEKVGSFLKMHLQHILTTEKAVNILENGLRYTAKAFKVLIEVGMTVVETSKQVLKDTKEFMGNVAKAVGSTVEGIYTGFVKKVKKVRKKIFDFIKNISKQ